MTEQPSAARGRADRTSWVSLDPDEDVRRRPPLTRPRIVRTALRFVDTKGLSALTMRSLANELEVSPMALYNHVRDKEELVDLMVDLMLGEVDCGVTEGDWMTQLRALARSYHQALSAHKHLAQIYGTGVRIGPHGLRVINRTVELLLQAGFSGPAVADAFFTLYTYIVGFHQIGRTNPGSRDDSDYFSALPPEEIPSIMAAAEHLTGMRRRGRFEFALDTLLAGLEVKLTA